MAHTENRLTRFLKSRLTPSKNKLPAMDPSQFKKIIGVDPNGNTIYQQTDNSPPNTLFESTGRRHRR